jgi:hypothetical protein
MAVLAQPKTESKKAVSIVDRWRGKTNYKSKRFTGFAPISFAMVAEVGRLTAGKATQLLYVILTASLGQIVAKEEPFKELATDLRTIELAELCGCDERTIQRELGDLKQREVILWEQTKKGVNSVTPLFRSWASLPDYKPAPVLEPDPEPEDEPAPEDPAQNAKQTTYLIKEPVFVRAGRKSKRVPVECGVSAFECEIQGKIDAACSAVVKDGVLRVILEAKWDGKTLGTSGLQIKGIKEKPRHPCRISPSETEGKRTKGERRSESENLSRIHPRASELCELFDPLILRWCGKTLSGDRQALLKACNAIGDTPHDVLVHDVVERSERTLKPAHAESICKEIEHNWQRSKTLPPQKKLPTREEIDAIIAREQKELAEARRKRRLA